MRILQNNNDLRINPIDTTSQPNMSSKYKLCNTMEQIIKPLNKYGFTIDLENDISYSKVKELKNEGYQKHVMVFKHHDFKIDDDNILQLLVTNSHNGTTSVKFDLGIFRTVCSNGLVVGDKLNSIRVLHRGNNFEDNLKRAIEFMIDNSDNAIDKVKRFREIILNPSQIVQFGNAALSKRFEDSRNKINRVDQIGTVKRLGDQGNDLYTVYNRIQEDVIRGKFHYVIETEDKKGNIKLKSRTARPINSIDKSTELNKFCWDYAAKLAA
jgi:hypothetical protein